MHADEADAVAALLLDANEENLAWFPPDVAGSYRTELLAVTDRPQTLVLHVGSRLAGTVVFVPDAQDDTHPWPAGGSVLRFLAVLPVDRGQRLGERLTRTCIDLARARGSAFLALHTAPSMHAARRVYEALGFERAPEHDFDPDAHYGRGRTTEEPAWGLAYLLHLEPAG